MLTNLPQLPCASLGSLEGTGCCCRINKKRVVENLRHIQCDALVPITNITVFYSTVPYSRRTGTWSWATIGQPGSAASRVEDEVRLTGPLLDHHVASSRLCCFLATGMQTIILAGHPYSCYTPQLVEQQRRLASAPCSLVHIPYSVILFSGWRGDWRTEVWSQIGYLSTHSNRRPMRQFVQ